MEELSPVKKFYDGKTIFITGATGFLGKVLIEKLLRCCTGIKKMYLLVRPKKGQDVENRVQDLVQCKVFDKLRKEQPNFHEKLIAIGGDIQEPEIGIDQADLQLLKEEVDVVFHSAATVKFDEPLRLALELNVIGVQKMIKLCKQLKHLEAFVHVSTAYANCDRPFIEEVIYPVPVHPHKLLDSLEWMDDDMLNSITPKLLGNKPNTYTYTKQLAEHLLVTEGASLPLAIVRPSIVGAAWKEPVAGWIDNYNGASGIYIATGKGVLRTMKAENSAVADIVPVDIPINMMITVAWYTGVTKPKSTLIYHACTGAVNPFTWGEMEPIVRNSFKRIPLDCAFRRPNLFLTNNSLLHDYWIFVSHLIPAYMFDLAYSVLGKKPRMVKTYNKLHKTIGTLDYFTTHSWEWTYHNLDMLRNQLSAEDKKTFYFDPRALHWPTYIENYCLGTKQYILNEDMAGLPAARAHMRKLRNIRYAFNTVLVVALWRILIARSDIGRNLWYLIMGLVFKFVRYFRVTSTIRKE
ncbi:fatty acyl-CoA reductase 1-like [Liolophura sinensis]|uniref:fatty acyl-CoA reductase 1-like n=1 Tax=Liolophura sinensis TaxID=3198878 RepID=UPI0031584841